MARFQDGYKKDLSSNQLTTATVERRPETKEAEVPTIFAIPDEAVDSKKGYYNIVYVLLHLKKEDDVN